MKFNPVAILGSNIREQTENYLDELPPLMMWGNFIFQLSTLAYSKLTVQDTWVWVSQGLIGKQDKLQYTGKKAPTIKFDCEMYDAFINPSLLTMLREKPGMINALSVDPVEHLRLQGNLRRPFMLVTGGGKVMGYWVLTDINQVMDSFRPNSEARHQVISLTLQFYGYRLNIDEPLSASIPSGGKTKEQKIQEAMQKMRDVIGGIE